MNTTGETMARAFAPPKPRKPKSNRLNNRQLAKWRDKLLNIQWAFRMAAKEDPALESIHKHLIAAWNEIGDLVHDRVLVEALRRDARLPENDRVCWELFLPKDYGWEAQQYIRRTRNTVTRQRSCFGKDVTVDAADPANVWSDLEAQLRRLPPFDAVKFRAHAERIDREWKAFKERELSREEAQDSQKEAAA